MLHDAIDVGIYVHDSVLHSITRRSGLMSWAPNEHFLNWVKPAWASTNAIHAALKLGFSPEAGRTVGNNANGQNSACHFSSQSAREKSRRIVMAHLERERVLRDGTAGMRRTGFCMIIRWCSFKKCFRKVDLMPASAFVLVKHALLDECFVAVFFASEPVATNKWQKIVLSSSEVRAVPRRQPRVQLIGGGVSSSSCFVFFGEKFWG
jgi:hypothetical protein